jgi:hypothetical protein
MLLNTPKSNPLEVVVIVLFAEDCEKLKDVEGPLFVLFRDDCCWVEVAFNVNELKIGTV